MNLALAGQVKNISSVMDKSKRIIYAVAGVLCDSFGKVLVSLRPNHVPQGGFWEFPGGKIEPDETSLQALCRELWEEVGIRVESANMISIEQHAYDDRIVVLETWQVEAFSGTPIGKEGQKIEWVSVAELAQRKFLPASEAAISALFAMTD